jgi:hypothetical protein
MRAQEPAWSHEEQDVLEQLEHEHTHKGSRNDRSWWDAASDPSTARTNKQASRKRREEETDKDRQRQTKTQSKAKQSKAKQSKAKHCREKQEPQTNVML